MGNGTPSDDCNLEIVQTIEGFNITFEPPEVGGNDTNVAAWVRSPQKMLDDLVDELRSIFEQCDLVVFKGDNTLHIVVKPEYRQCRDEVRFICMYLHSTARVIDLVNLIRQTPVNGQSLRNLGRKIVNGNTPKLGQAFTAWRDELTQFGVWVHALRSIDPKSCPLVTPPDRTTRSATIEDVQVAYDALVEQKVKPTKDAIGAYLREHSMTAGGTRLNTMKRTVEKQSAVRPPESAD